MTDFQLSMIAGGVGFVVLVLIFNKWQEYKAKKSVDRAFSGDRHDVLMNPVADSNAHAGDISRQEPSLDGVAFNADAAMMADPMLDAMPDGSTGDTSGAFATSATSSMTASMPSKMVMQRELPVDELIDCVIPLEFDVPVRGEKLLAEIAHLKFVGKKSVHFIGLNDQGERDVVAHGGAYTTLFAGIQMVSRSGPLNELEYSEFVGQLRMIAEHLNAHSDVPDMNQVMATARELHQFVLEHDAQLSVNVMANSAPWEVASLLAALEKQGFDLRPDGRLVMPDGDGGSLFSLSTNVGVSEAVTSRLTLLLDVPCVAPNRDAFGAMAACAKSLSMRLGGVVVDDGNQAISKIALDEIAIQVNEFYAAMAEAQIPAGSLRAQRLFS